MLLRLVTEEDWLMPKMIIYTSFYFMCEQNPFFCQLSLIKSFKFVIQIILGIHQSSSVTKQSSICYINLHQINSYTPHANTLLTGIFTPRYWCFSVIYGVHLGYIKAYWYNPNYTDHLVLVTEEDTGRISRTRTTNMGVAKNSVFCLFLSDGHLPWGV